MDNDWIELMEITKASGYVKKLRHVRNIHIAESKQHTISTLRKDGGFLAR